MINSNVIAQWTKEKLDRTGNSKSIIIPKKYVDKLNLENGFGLIQITVEKNKIIIQKVGA